MFNKETIQKLIKVSFISDSYSLGSHWVYDEDQLKSLPIDWDRLNTPQALWHKGKKAGDFTHIGDQAYWLYEFLQDKEKFEAQDYLAFWEEKMKTYEGYKDGASRETLENIRNGKMSGSNSHDFSVIGRIPSLLLVSKSEDEFINNVQAFVKLSHDDEKVVEVATFFAKLLLHVKSSQNIEKTMEELSLSFSDYIQNAVQEGIESKDKDTFTTIREFGPACDVDEGFRGIVHLLARYPDDLKELLVQNAKAGGDNSSRAMVASSVLIAKGVKDKLPESWYKLNI